MRQTVFSSIVFLFIWTGKVLAQNVPFPERNAVWKLSQTTIAGPIFSHVAICGDTVINGTDYSQVVQLELDSALNVTGSSFLGGLRAVGNSVRYLPAGAAQSFELYNFGLVAGDVVSVFVPSANGFTNRLVDSVRVEDLAGKPRKVIYFAPSESWMPVERWMEGIGSSYGLLGRAAEPFPDFGNELLCFQHGLEYHNETLIECFLPQLPAACRVLNGDKEPAAKLEKLSLKAVPNPAGPAIRFTTNQAQLPERCLLKIYAANGKLLGAVANAQPEMNLPDGLSLMPGFYIATLESERTERVLAHCTFVVGE
jgi:hypothetical protein